MLTHLWVAIPKYVLWKVLIARNHDIFYNKKITTFSMSIFAKLLLREFIQLRINSKLKSKILIMAEEQWLKKISLRIEVILECPKLYTSYVLDGRKELGRVTNLEVGNELGRILLMNDMIYTKNLIKSPWQGRSSASRTYRPNNLKWRVHTKMTH